MRMTLYPTSFPLVLPEDRLWRLNGKMLWLSQLVSQLPNQQSSYCSRILRPSWYLFEGLIGLNTSCRGIESHCILIENQKEAVRDACIVFWIQYNRFGRNQFYLQGAWMTEQFSPLLCCQLHWWGLPLGLIPNLLVHESWQHSLSFVFLWNISPKLEKTVSSVYLLLILETSTLLNCDIQLLLSENDKTDQASEPWFNWSLRWTVWSLIVFSCSSRLCFLCIHQCHIDVPHCSSSSEFFHLCTKIHIFAAWLSHEFWQLTHLWIGIKCFYSLLSFFSLGCSRMHRESRVCGFMFVFLFLWNI